MAVWYILWPFGKFCPVLVYYTKNNLATLCPDLQVVKFADTQKDKEQKKVQQLQNNLWSLAGISSPPPSNVLQSPYLAVRTINFIGPRPVFIIKPTI
jgi:hypothetical protein